MTTNDAPSNQPIRRVATGRCLNEPDPAHAGD